MGTVQIEVEVPPEDHVSEMQIVGPHPALGQWLAGHGIPARRRAGLCPPLPPPPPTAYSGLATDYCHGVEDAGAHFAGIWRAWRSMRHFACCHFACLFASSTSLCMSLCTLVCAQVPEPTRTSRQQRVGGNG
jgi:hypothetical protein